MKTVEDVLREDELLWIRDNQGDRCFTCSHLDVFHCGCENWELGESETSCLVTGCKCVMRAY
jgi:hypothetical protein